MRLTKTNVEGAEPGSVDRFLWDERLPGFGVKITPKGRRTYVVQYRVRGRAQTRRITLGQHGAPWTTDKAREVAEGLLLRARTGEDPVETQRLGQLAIQKAKEAAQLAEKSVFETVLNDFIELYAAPKNRRWKDARRVIQFDALPLWKGKPIGSITRRDVIELIDAARKRSPSSARALYAQLRRMFAWCVEREIIENSPFTGLRAPPSVPSRVRWLSDSEIRLLWAALEEDGGPFEPLFKVLLLTGQRREEVTGMRWEEIDLNRGEWIIPRERSKNFKEHAVDLSPQCVEILRSLKATSELVFTTTGATPLSNHAKARQRYCLKMQAKENRAAVEEKRLAKILLAWTVHDLRRTAATGMAALGVAPSVIEAILNHSSGARGGLVAVYQHYEHRKERRQALLAWADHVAEVTAPTLASAA